MGEPEIQSLTRIFDDAGEDVVAVDDFSAEIDDGEFAVRFASVQRGLVEGLARSGMKDA